MILKYFYKTDHKSNLCFVSHSERIIQTKIILTILVFFFLFYDERERKLLLQKDVDFGHSGINRIIEFSLHYFQFSCLFLLYYLNKDFWVIGIRVHSFFLHTSCLDLVSYKSCFLVSAARSVFWQQINW